MTCKSRPDQIPRRAHTQGPCPRAQPHRGPRTTPQDPGDSPARNQQTRHTIAAIRNPRPSLRTTPSLHLDSPPMVPTAPGPDPPPPATAAGGPQGPSPPTHPPHTRTPTPRKCLPRPRGIQASNINRPRGGHSTQPRKPTHTTTRKVTTAMNQRTRTQTATRPRRHPSSYCTPTLSPHSSVRPMKGNTGDDKGKGATFDIVLQRRALHEPCRVQAPCTGQSYGDHSTRPQESTTSTTRKSTAT